MELTELLSVAASVVALVISIGGAFYMTGVVNQKLNNLEKRQDSTDAHLLRVDADLTIGVRERAAMSTKLDMMLANQSQMAGNQSQMLEKLDQAISRTQARRRRSEEGA